MSIKTAQLSKTWLFIGVFAIMHLFSFGQSTVTVSGKVTGVNGVPLEGAFVTEVGAPSNGVATKADGSYTLTVDEGSSIEVTFIGYATQVQQVTSATLNFALVEGENVMDEVVVVGFATQKKVNLTGAVSSVTSKSLEERPVTSTGQALQGLIPGLNLQVGGLGGELNNRMGMNIRGLGTIGATSSAPLVLIDGMEGDINAINVQDIESISVLKDAASASIYGSRAAFGVILVTTKKGKAGKPTINYNNNFRWTSPLNMPSMLDGERFALYFNESALNNGSGAVFSDLTLSRIRDYMSGVSDSATHRSQNPNEIFWDSYGASNASTNWFDVWYNKAAFAQNHNVSLNGGSDRSKYFISLGYLGQDGLLKIANDWFKRYTATAKINTNISEHVEFNYTGRFVRESYDKPAHMNDLFYHNVSRRWPTLPVYDPNGHYFRGAELAQMAEGGRVNDIQDWNYQQGQFVFKPLPGWRITTDINYRIFNRNQSEKILPAYVYDVHNRPVYEPVSWYGAGQTRVYEYSRKDDYFSTNLYTDYTKRINRHDFKVLVGFNSELNKYRTLAGSRTGLITPLVPTISTATANSMANEGQYQHWATAGFFGRLNYNYAEKYLVELNTRYDGTSRYREDLRWNWFPSVSLGWNIAKENFFPTNLNIQNLKLRASYGELGNQNTSRWYPFYPIQPVGINNSSWLIGGQRPNTASVPPIISSLLTWERVSTFNYGIDISAFRSKLTMIVDIYKRKTFDMVGPAPDLPVILGTGVPQINNTDMESKGFEVELNWRDRIGKFGYGIRGVLSDDQQTVTRYNNPTGNLNSYYAGRKIGEIWGWTTAGIARDQAEMDAHTGKVNQNALGGNWQAGDIMFADLNGDGRVDGGANTLGNHGDISIIGNSSPRYRYSLDLTGDYQGFDFRVFIQGVGKRDYMPNGPYFWGTNTNMWQAAGFEQHLDYWRDENSLMVKAGLAEVNREAYFPRPYMDAGGKNTRTQTRYLQNAAYMRVKAIQLGYTIPAAVTNRVGMSKARVFVSGENLFTVTKLFDVFDPETVALSGWNDGKTYPLSKVYSCGLSVTF